MLRGGEEGRRPTAVPEAERRVGTRSERPETSARRRCDELYGEERRLAARGGEGDGFPKGRPRPRGGTFANCSRARVESRTAS